MSLVRFRPWATILINRLRRFFVSFPSRFSRRCPIASTAAIKNTTLGEHVGINLLKPRWIIPIALSKGRTDVRALLTVIGLLIVTACASSSPRSQQHFTTAPLPPPGYATLYIYRGYMEQGAAVWPIVYLNGVKVADIKTYSYTYCYVWPGKYHLRADKSFVLTQFADNEYEFDFDIPSEGTYYLQFRNGGGPSVTLPAGHTFVSLPTGDYGWFLMPESGAQSLLSQTFYQPAYVQTVGHQ